MHRFGWLLLGLGVFLLLGRGAFLLVPFLFLPLLFGAIFFALKSFRFSHHHHGPRSYHWRGRHGYYYDQHPSRRCGPEYREGPPPAAKRDEAYTGDTTRL